MSTKRLNGGNCIENPAFHGSTSGVFPTPPKGGRGNADSQELITRPQHGRVPSEQMVAINRNARSQSAGACIKPHHRLLRDWRFAGPRVAAETGAGRY
jgi:hypothetical protein